MASKASMPTLFSHGLPGKSLILQDLNYLVVGKQLDACNK